MGLRDYQVEDVAAIKGEWQGGVRSTLYVAATGLGKTRVATAVVKDMLPKRTIFLCHRGELLFQAREAFMREGLECDMEKAELSASTNLFNRAQVVLATVQTLTSGEVEKKRMTRFNPMDFGLLVYDESHHSPAPGNKSIVDYFTSGNPNLKVLGLTATPSRADESALGQIFETVVGNRDILFGINNGWLVNVEQLFVQVESLDFSHIRTTAGDLNGADLAAVMEEEENIQGVVQPTVEALVRLPLHALNGVPVTEWGSLLETIDRSTWRRGIVFASSVKQSEALSNIFNRVAPGISDWVCGKTSDEERARIFSRFRNGERCLLVNVGVTTEGYDNPMVDLIVQGRPTKSELLYMQTVGRGTRVLPGLVEGVLTKDERIAIIKSSAKPSVLVMDFVGNSGRHKLVSSGDILGGEVSDAAIERAIKKAKESPVPVNMTEAMLAEEERLRKQYEEIRRREEARKAHLVAKVKYSTTKIDPFNALDIMPPRERGWNSGKVPSEKMLRLVRNQGIDPTGMPYGAVLALCREIIRRFQGKLCSTRQANVVKKYYPELDTKKMSFQAASRIINEIAKNNWQRSQIPPPT